MRKPDPMIPGKPGAEDVPAMRNRQAWVEALYKYEGRDDKDHPMHGLVYRASEEALQHEKH